MIPVRIRILLSDLITAHHLLDRVQLACITCLTIIIPFNGIFLNYLKNAFNSVKRSKVFDEADKFSTHVAPFAILRYSQNTHLHFNNTYKLPIRIATKRALEAAFVFASLVANHFINWNNNTKTSNALLVFGIQHLCWYWSETLHSIKFVDSFGWNLQFRAQIKLWFWALVTSWIE